MAYIGNIPVPQATQTRDRFTATSGQTTFATSGYSPNSLDVYLNGVHLDASDYTATNGSDVVLDTGAATDDSVEVVAFTAFTPANIDAVSAANGGTFSGAITVDEDGATVATFDRATSDGTIVDLQKNGSTVGSIGVASSDLYIGEGTVNLRFDGENARIFPATTAGAPSDASLDLGADTIRFKDLYLSGGVYLGGTGAANYLDDYEEGTWSPYFTSTGGGSATMGGATEGVYVKTGNVVYVHANLEMTTNSLNSGGMEVRGLPFTPSGTSSYRNGTAFFSYTVNVVPQPFGGTFNTGWNYLQRWNEWNNSTYQATNWYSGGRAVFSGFYFTT